MDNVERVKQTIKDKGIDAEVIEHTDMNIMDTASHLAYFKCGPGVVMKALCFVSKGMYRKQGLSDTSKDIGLSHAPAVVIASGDVKIDMKKLSEATGLKKPRMASEQELKELFSAVPGGVSPLTVPPSVPIFVDKKFLEKDMVIGSAGAPNAGLKIKPTELVRFIDAKIVDLAEG